MNKSPNIKSLIKAILPDHIQAKYPNLVEFAEAFFKYLDEENKASYYQNTLYKQRDIREQKEEFLSLIQRELGLLSRKSFAADPKVFYDHLSSLWTSKGSEESIKTFFRLFLDDEITVYYPWESVLIPSDGRWKLDQVLRVSMISGDPNDFVGKTIRQIGSDGIASVSKVEKARYKDGDIFELYLLGPTIVSKFITQQNIYAVENESLVAEVYKSVTDLKILKKGSGYKVGNKIQIQGYDGITFVAYVGSVDENGGILSVDIVNFGAGNTPSYKLDSESPPVFYYKDFLVYENSISIIDELEANGISDFYINSRKDYLTYFRFTEPLSLLDGIVGSLDHDYVETQDLYFAEDYSGTTAFNTQGSVGGGITQKDYSGVLGPTVLPISVNSDTGSGAEFEIEFGAISSYSGYYEGIKGQLSESIVLQDSKYYQKFSYEIKTTHSTDIWLETLKKTIHPSGVEVFGNITVYDENFVGITDSRIFVKAKQPANYQLLENAGITDTVDGLVQDYVTNNNDSESFDYGTDIYFAESYVGDTAFSDSNTINASSSNVLNDAIVTTNI